jgi:hypothetical protein
MFRLIILWQLKEGIDPQPFIDALEAMPARVPSIKRAVAAGDLGLTKQYGHNCSFSWVAEFEDQAGWAEYIASPAHDEFAEMFMPACDQFLVNQWVLPAGD